MDIRECLTRYIDPIEVTEHLNPDSEITIVARENSTVPVLFHDVNGRKLVSNLYANRDFVARCLGVTGESLLARISEAIRKPETPKVTVRAPFLANLMEPVDMGNLPVPHFYHGDGGPYMTASVFSAGGLVDGNISYHRVMVTGKDRGSVRLVPRDLHDMYSKQINRGEELPVAISIGVPIEVAIAAAVSVDRGINEYGIAAGLSGLAGGPPLELFRTENNCYVPSGSEYVLLGRLTASKEPEGPFVDITGTRDGVRDQPVLEIDKIYHRDDPLYHAIVPGCSEHFLLMGMPREARMMEYLLGRGFDVADVTLTPGGCSWLHGVVSIRKHRDDEGSLAGEAALDAHRSMKHVVVVDEDIDVRSPREVEWAFATRFQGDTDLRTFPGERGSSLDPSGPGGTTTKIIFDATMPMTDRERFMRVDI